MSFWKMCGNRYKIQVCSDTGAVALYYKHSDLECTLERCPKTGVWHQQAFCATVRRYRTVLLKQL
jgi:hypothetical protein